MTSAATGYQLDFYDFDGAPGTGREIDQLVWRDTWSSDESAQCKQFNVSSRANYVRITKTGENGNEHDVLFSRTDDGGEANAIRFHQGCFEIHESFPGVNSCQIVSARY